MSGSSTPTVIAITITIMRILQVILTAVVIMLIVIIKVIANHGLKMIKFHLEDFPRWMKGMLNNLIFKMEKKMQKKPCFALKLIIF